MQNKRIQTKMRKIMTKMISINKKWLPQTGNQIVAAQ